MGRPSGHAGRPGQRQLERFRLADAGADIPPRPNRLPAEPDNVSLPFAPDLASVPVLEAEAVRTMERGGEGLHPDSGGLVPRGVEPGDDLSGVAVGHTARVDL